MKLFRCVNDECPNPGEFEADTGVCPACKGTEASQKVQELAVIHYLVADETGPIKTKIGARRIACMPARARLPKHATGERSAVSCPACKASKVFQEHDRAEVDQHVPFVEAKMSAEHGTVVVQG